MDSGFYIKPIKAQSQIQVLLKDAVSGEITYDTGTIDYKAQITDLGALILSLESAGYNIKCKEISWQLLI